MSQKVQSRRSIRDLEDKHSILRTPSGQPPLRPLKSPRSPIKKRQNIRQAFLAVCAAEVPPILHNWQVVLQSDDPKGPHKFRVSLRRFRTALQAFRLVVRSEQLDRLRDELKELGRVVGRLRDQDVLLADIVGPVERLPELAAGFHELDALLNSKLGEQRQSVREALTSERWSNVMLELAMLSHGTGLKTDQPMDQMRRHKVKRVARSALDACWRRAKKLGERIDDLSIAERHALRKKLKSLRYTVQIFAPILPRKACRAYLKKLAALQDVFGYLNDATLAEQLLDYQTPFGSGSKTFDQAVGFIVGYHECKSDTVWHDARRRWDQLLSVQKPWR